MKALLVLACVVSLAAAGLMDQDWMLGRGRNWNSNRIGRDSITHDDLLRQKFLLDVVQHVNQPLRNKELLNMATTLIVDDSKYIGNIDTEMLRIIELGRQHRLLGKNTICTVTEDEHLRQMIGLYRLLVRSRDWDTFQRNVCYMRQNVNGVLFVNALLLAVRDREDTQHLIVPAVHEILPELFLDHELLMQVDEINMSHLSGDSETRNPNLLDLVGSGRRTGSWALNRSGLGLDRTRLWMPWREMHRQLSIQRIGVGKPLVSIRNEDKIVLPVKSRRTDTGLLTEDVGLKSWLQILISDLCLTEGEILGRSMANVGDIRSSDRRPINTWGRGIVEDRNRVNLNEGDHILDNQWSGNLRGGINDYRRVMVGDLQGKGVRGVRLDETLPTTDINSNRLVHVNRRRWNVDNAQMIEGLRSIVDVDDDLNLDQRMNLNRRSGGIRDGRHTDNRNDRDEDVRTWKVDVDEGMNIRNANTDRGMRTVSRNMEDIGTDRWSSRSDDIRNRRMQRMRDANMVMDTVDDTPRSWNMNVDVDEDVHNNRMWRDNQRNRMTNRRSQINDGRMVDEGHWWNVRGGVTENDRRPWNMDVERNANVDWDVDMGLRGMNVLHKDRGIWTTSRGMGDIGTERSQLRSDRTNIHRDKLNTRMMDNILVGDSNMGVPNTHRRSARSIHQREDLDLDRLNVDLRESGIVVLHNLQQIIARIKIERIALGLIDTDNVERNIGRTQRLNNARLGVDERMALRLNEMRIDSRINRNLIEKINEIEQRLETVIRREVRRIADIRQLGDVRTQRDINHVIGEILVGNVDGVGILEIVRVILLETQDIHGVQTLAHVGVLPLNDPLILHLLSRLVRIIDQCRQEHLGAVRLEDIRTNGLTINDAKVDQLRTHIDLSDLDLINLLDSRLILSGDRMQKVVVGRHQRLNHKEFDIKVDITADCSRRVLMRTLLVPRMDGVGRELDVEEQRRNALLLDTTVLDLQTGRNTIKRGSTNIMWTARDTTPLTQIYKTVMMALDGKIDIEDVRQDLVGQNCRFPHRLLLPRGTTNGLNMQLVIVVTPIEGIQQTVRSGLGVREELMCLMGVSTNTIDDLPLMFPLDRKIDNIQSLMNVPNVHVMDVVIRHEDKVKVTLI